MATRIHVFGASGSGCTTLGRALAERLDCVNLDSDTYFWLPSDPPFQQMRDREERRVLLGADLQQHESWTLSGSISGWGDVFIPLFDLVVFLWVPPAVRLTRLAERERRRFGAEALAPGGVMHENHATFMAWAAEYDTGDVTMRSRARHEQWLPLVSCPVVRLEGTGTVDEHTQAVLARLDSPDGAEARD
jgi:adenylate kinase family enzyme